MKYVITVILLLLFISNSEAQQHKDKIKRTAQILLDATIEEDYSTVLDYSYPKLIALQGGKDSVLNMIKDGFKKMKAEGRELVIVKGSLGDPGDEVKIGNSLYCVIPEMLTLMINKNYYKTTGSLIGISSDSGKNWVFVDAAGLDGLKTLVPDIDKLNIPPSTGPTQIDNK